MTEDAAAKTENVPTGKKHSFILHRRVGRRLEIEDVYFNTGSAVFLPTVPAASGGSDDRPVEFSNDELWSELNDSQKRFSEDVRSEPFDPERSGDESGAEQRESGLYVLVSALRFLEQNQAHKLLITGHADRAGSDSYNLALSDARARSALALLESDRNGFVSVCAKYNVAEDDPIVLRFAAREYLWPCDPAHTELASPAEIKAFQSSFNNQFGGDLAVDGVVGNQTRGAYFQLYQDAMARSAGGTAALESLRGQLRFIRADRKYLACGERFPIENGPQDGYRSQRNRRVELLFFAPPDLPDLDGSDPAKVIYDRKTYTIRALDRDTLASAAGASPGDPFSPPPLELVDAMAPEPGVGEPEDELETSMASAGEEDPTDQYAFLDPFDRTFPDSGHQAVRDTDTVLV